MGHADATLIVFARQPLPGNVKTRLIPALGAEGAARLYERLLLGTLDEAMRSSFRRVQLWCDPDEHHPLWREHVARPGWSARPQRGADLGERMRNAFVETLARCDIAVLIGSDSASLMAADLDQSLAVLARVPAVLGPAEDGGYLLIGLTRRHVRDARVLRALFEGMAWGTDTVAAETCRRLRGLGVSWEELPAGWDVDRPEDLERLARVRPDLMQFNY